MRLSACPFSLRYSPNKLIMNATRGRSLVQKRQLLTCAVAANLRWRLSDKVSQRPRQMRLIVIAGLYHGVENRGPLLKEGDGISGTFNLAHGALGQPGRAQEAPLYCPCRQRPDMAL